MAAALLLLFLAACGGDGRTDLSRLARVSPPPEHEAGADLFRRHCQACHGPNGTGSAQGPPLVDWVYEPNHHGDAAFLLAVRRGVSAHHWRFGDMPPVPGVSDADVSRIVGYVRWLQREVGIE